MGSRSVSSTALSSTAAQPKLLQEGVGSRSVYSTALSSTAAQPKLLQEGVGSRSVYSTALFLLLLNLNSFRKV